MRESFELKQNLNIIELYNASIYLGLRNKRLVKFFYLIPTIILISSIAGFFLSPKPNFRWDSIVLQILVPLMFPVVFFTAGVLLICIVLALLKPNNFRNITYLFNHWGVSKNGKKIEYSAPWRNFTKWKETKSFILLYISDSNAHIFQKKLFKNPEEIEEFKIFINTKVKRG